MEIGELTKERKIAHAGMMLQIACHEASYDAGWWKDVETGVDLRDLIRQPGGKGVSDFASLELRFAKALVAEKLALVHTEVSEGTEGHRKDRMDDKLPHRKMIEVELADAIIRICDLAGALELDLGGAIAEKLAYNAVRPDHKLENRAAEGGKAY